MLHVLDLNTEKKKNNQTNPDLYVQREKTSHMAGAM